MLTIEDAKGQLEYNLETISAVRIYKGQRYECVALDEYRGANGSVGSLATWESECAQCGARFTFRRAVKAGVEFAPSRRCREHAAPGRRV